METSEMSRYFGKMLGIFDSKETLCYISYVVGTDTVRRQNHDHS